MAELPAPQLVFQGTCPDCGERRITLPPPLPPLGDDFDWASRDFDSFRRLMLQELAARFPERLRWTPGDLEVVLVEALAAVLDQLSDMLDRVAAETWLETARRPETVRRLLKVIGYDAVRLAADLGDIPPVAGEAPEATAERLDSYWLANPHRMEEARRAGPRAVHLQQRMVTTEDYARRLEDHPLVLRAHAWSGWTGSWNTLRIAVIAWSNRNLDGEEVEQGGGRYRLPQPYPRDIQAAVEEFHARLGIPLPALTSSPPPSIRTVLRPYLEAWRMVGQPVVLVDAEPVAVTFSLSVRVAGNFYRSEVRHAVAQALGTGPGGFFEPGRLAFGEDLHASDLIQALMALGGVESVCLNRFKRLGSQFEDQAGGASRRSGGPLPGGTPAGLTSAAADDSGRIRLADLELAVCDNDPANPSRGYYRLTLHGGIQG